MRVNIDELRGYVRDVPPPPPPVEPLLTPQEEARVIADRDRTDAVTHARRQRVLALLRRPAPPEGADAELVVLLAAAKALPLETDDDRLRARTRLAEIGRLKAPPPAVLAVRDACKVDPGDGQGLADVLLPQRRGPSEFYESGAGFVGGGH